MAVALPGKKRKKKFHFIAIEGVDGVGKTTMGRRIAREMKWAYVCTPPSRFRRHPDKSEIGDLMRYALGLMENAKTIRSLRARQNVVCDRFWATFKVDAKMAGANYHVFRLEPLLPKPELTIHLRADYPSIVRRIRSARKIHRYEKRILADRAYFDALVKGFSGYCNAELDTTGLTARQSFERVQKLLDARLK